MIRRAPVLRIESHKLYASPVAQVAAWAAFVMSTATSAGGYAATAYAPGTDMGRKAAAMINGAGWSGYVGLSSLSLGITLLLAAGIVASWAVGREFTDGTIVGLFAISASRASVARAKLVACLGWGLTLILAQTIAAVVAGIALGLDPAGAFRAWLTLTISGFCLLSSVLPIAWVATQWRGYLAGIGATLGVLVATNLASGLGMGRYVPWAIPTLWASGDPTVPPAALILPLAVGLAGWCATTSSWGRIQLGRN